jgi:nucleotide-binding universal stress UspA family protein
MYQKVLAPLDGSELAECTLRHVQAIATACNIPEVIILKVVEPLSSTVVSAYAEAGSAGADMLNKAEEQTKVEAQNYIDKVSQRLKSAGIQVKAEVIEGNAAEVILDYARDNQVDLIVMSTHGRSGISRFAFGSVADKVVRHALAPVLTISPPG